MPPETPEQAIERHTREMLKADAEARFATNASALLAAAGIALWLILSVAGACIR